MQNILTQMVGYILLANVLIYFILAMETLIQHIWELLE